MKITCDTKAFIAAMTMAGRVIPAKAPWPILANLKIVTNDDRITLIGSDADTTFEMDVPATVETEGLAAIPFAPLAKFVSACKADQIKIEEKDGQATLRGGRSKITLSSARVEDFPNYRPADGEPVKLDGPSFCNALRFVASAVEDSEVKFHIAGACFREEAGRVDLWGTDGKSCHHASLNEVDGIGGGGTLPFGAIGIVLGIAEKAETLDFAISDRGWHLRVGPVRAWGKVIDGTYPDMHRVTGQFKDWSPFAILPRDDIANAITVATCGADADSQKSRNIILRAALDGPIVFRGQKGIAGVVHAGRAELDLPGRADFSGVVSSRYLSGAIGGMRADEFTLSGDGGGKGLRMEPAQMSATVSMSAVMMCLHASEAEMADV